MAIDKRQTLLDQGVSENDLKAIEAHNKADVEAVKEIGLETKSEAVPTEVVNEQISRKEVAEAISQEIAKSEQQIAQVLQGQNEVIVELQKELADLKAQLVAKEKKAKEDLTPTASIADILNMQKKRAVGNPETKVHGNNKLAKAGPEVAAADVRPITPFPAFNQQIAQSRFGGNG